MTENGGVMASGMGLPGAAVSSLKVEGAGSVASSEAAFAEWFEPLARLGAVLTGSRVAGEDVAQEAFVRLYPRFSRIDDPRSYLRRTVVNLCRDRSRRKIVSDRADRLLRTEESVLPVDSLLFSLGALSDRQRAAIVLRFYVQCSESEIAEIMRCRPGTVKSLLSRGLATLRKVLPHES